MVSLNTMRTHTKNIYAKLGVTTAAPRSAGQAELELPRTRGPVTQTHAPLLGFRYREDELPAGVPGRRSRMASGAWRSG